MATLSPPDMQPFGVVSTRLARDEPGQTTRKVAQRSGKTVKKLTTVPDLLGLRGRRWERTSFSQNNRRLICI